MSCLYDRKMIISPVTDWKPTTSCTQQDIDGGWKREREAESAQKCAVEISFTTLEKNMTYLKANRASP